MKKLKIFGFALLAVIFVVSCGESKKETVDVKPATTKVKGKLSDFLEVVDGTYKINKGSGAYGGDWQILVKVKSIGTTDEQFNEIHGKEKKWKGGLTLTLFDETGLPIAGLEKFELHYAEKDKVIYLLENEGEEDFLKFIVDVSSKSPLYESLPDNIKSFEVGSEVTDYVSDNYSSSYSSSGSEDWDAVLDSYEQYINQYIKLLKKAQNGDMDAMSEYAEMMDKATDLAEKMEDAGDDLSSAQMSRFVKLQSKLANSVSDL